MKMEDDLQKKLKTTLQKIQNEDDLKKNKKGDNIKNYKWRQPQTNKNKNDLIKVKN